MYLDFITVRNLRVFEEAKVSLQYPGRPVNSRGAKLLLPNVTLILGNNGAGKSTLLKAMGLAALGPVGEKFPAYKLVRLTKQTGKTSTQRAKKSAVATIDASFQLTWQDLRKKKPSTERRELQAHVEIERRGDEEFVRLPNASNPAWEPIYNSKSPAFLTVGYGATRRVDTDATSSLEQRTRHMPLRQQRVQSLFSDHYSLVPLGQWLPQLRKNPGRFKQVVARLNDVLPSGYSFTAETDRSGDFLFRQGRAVVPFPALSDGCRAFVGWVADLLYHICMGAPSGVKLVENCGLVLVDEIDLHLHPD
jgi:predicted ATP-binding protein involved in virulence